MTTLQIKVQRSDARRDREAVAMARGLAGLVAVRRREPPMGALADDPQPSWWDAVLHAGTTAVDAIANGITTIRAATQSPAPVPAPSPAPAPAPAPVAAQSQWIKGVPNGLVVIGGSVAAVLVLGMIARRK